MKRPFLLSTILVALSLSATAQSPCPAATVAEVLGTTCSIGPINFTFGSEFSGFTQRVPLATNAVETTYLAPSDVGFRPVIEGTKVGFQLIAIHVDSPSEAGDFDSGYSVQIFYSYQAIGDSGVSTEIVRLDGAVSGTDNAYVYAFGSQCYQGGACTVVSPGTGVIPGQPPFSTLEQTWTLGTPQTQSVQGGRANIGSFAYTTSTATLNSGTFLFDTVNVLPPAFTYSTLRYPGASITRLFGVNNHGDMVGNFRLATPGAAFHAFAVLHGRMQQLDPDGILGKNSSLAAAVNDRGDIVGAFTDSARKQHGFIYSSGQITIVDHPSAGRVTALTGINESGTSVGLYIDADGVSHAFIYDKGQFETPSLPGSENTFYGINTRGEITGWSGDAFTNEAFVYRKGKTEMLSIPGELPGTGFGQSVNNKGEVLVSYLDGVTQVGSVLSHGRYDAVVIPDSRSQSLVA